MAVHLGRNLKRELNVRELSANKLALALHLPSGRITSILSGKRSSYNLDDMRRASDQVRPGL